MENVTSVTAAGTAAMACAGGMALEGFLAKADSDTALEALIFQNAERQAQMGKQGVKLHSRQAAEARERRFEALVRMQEASRKGGFFGRLGKILGPVFTGLYAALKICSLATAATGVGLAGAVICGALYLAKNNYEARAGRAKADSIEQQATAESQKLMQEECRDFLQQAVELEKNMLRGLRKVGELQSRTPAYCGGPND